VFTVIMRITRNRQGAEELTLDVFHDLWRKASRYDPEAGPVLGWILIQARSRALDRLRHERREKRVAGAEDWRDESVVLNSEEMVAKRQAGRALREALSALTAGELLAIETAYFSELSYTEAAERLGEPVGTVKTRIRSGLTKLRKVLVCEEDP
jgi:RNA polymerase sigma-70 factor (ECF subfamily)